MFCKVSLRSVPQPASRLDGVAEEGGIVTAVCLHLLLGAGVLCGSLVGGITASVLAAEVEGHADGQDARHGDGADKSAVAGAVVRSVVLAVDEARDGTAEVTEADVHGDTDTSLERAADVVTVPGDTLGNVGVDARGDEEAGKVLGTVVLDTGKDSEAKDTKRQRNISKADILVGLARQAGPDPSLGLTQGSNPGLRGWGNLEK